MSSQLTLNSTLARQDVPLDNFRNLDASRVDIAIEDGPSGYVLKLNPAPVPQAFRRLAIPKPDHIPDSFRRQESVLESWEINGKLYILTKQATLPGQAYEMEEAQPYYLIIVNEEGRIRRISCEPAQTNKDGACLIPLLHPDTQKKVIFFLPNESQYGNIEAHRMEEGYAIGIKRHSGPTDQRFASVIDFTRGEPIGDLIRIPLPTGHRWHDRNAIEISSIKGVCGSPDLAVIDIKNVESTDRYLVYPQDHSSKLAMFEVSAGDLFHEIDMYGNFLKVVRLQNGFKIVFDDDLGIGVFDVNKQQTTLDLTRRQNSSVQYEIDFSDRISLSVDGKSAAVTATRYDRKTGKETKVSINLEANDPSSFFGTQNF